MGRLIWILLGLALCWDGVWFAATGAARSAVQAEIDTTPQVTVAEITRTGFPLSFGLRARDITVTSRGGAVEWAAPQIVLRAPGIAPHQPRLKGYPGQTLRLGEQTYRLDFAAMTGGADVALSAAMTLQAADLRLDAPQLVPQDMPGGPAAVSADAVALEVTQAAPGMVEIKGGIDALALPETLAAELRARAESLPAPGLPEVIERIGLRLRATLDAPLDRAALDAAPKLTALDIDEIGLRWGALALAAQGRLDIDAQGRPEGRVTLRTTRWREMLSMAADLGVIDPQMEPSLASMLQSFAVQDAAGGDSLDLPLIFQNGLMSLGPLPLGPAPRLLAR
ncbi:DUF2125 domain-containing protein [Phaeovulum vinaykumarii]|uniref:DUF2125 domain-containing protein n=1 Tax=Phaeovulum vinaykumarii TaxID=407234 RepID=A0A1N7JTB4_9RHOB|nr:DUF2125 domain-containing protein [Phaeovulum vinaykumarii]SIS52444.1 hypothetical protein SAMN05421795_101307 [Phaeovulum vinaykumarii]SOB91223.1 hypothetical protein SAMN05878426_101307 [Phaeovulum vinaykumarii]